LIGIYNLEPYTNIALEKIRLYYQNEGVRDYNPLEHHLFDKIYCSSIFTHSNKSYVTDDMICGGSGFDLTTTLPSEIEVMKPKINIGFTTRGCIRKCPFCIVPEKEGKIKVVGDIYDFWDRKSREITILDNNILALPEHFKTICEQLREENLVVDFNQGLDFRLLNDLNIKILKRIRHKEYRFAFDWVSESEKVVQAIGLLKKHNINRSIWYVLVGFNSSKGEDLERLNLLRNLGQSAYVQRYNKITNRYFIRLSQWANQHNMFPKYTFDEFCIVRGDGIE